MSSIVIKGNTSGQIELAAPDVAGSTTLTLPTGSGSIIKDDGSGNLSPTGGIYLGGTASANLLDDYEEGTWTPTSVSGFTLGTVYNANYIKIGNLVYVAARIQVTCGAGSGTIQIGGLPFAPTYSNGITAQGNTNFDFEGGSVNVASSITLSHNLTTATRTISPSAIYEVI